jgi:hypothetical protein
MGQRRISALLVYGLIFAGSSAVQGLILWIHLGSADHDFGQALLPTATRVVAEAPHSHAGGVFHTHDSHERPAPSRGRARVGTSITAEERAPDEHAGTASESNAGERSQRVAAAHRDAGSGDPEAVHSNQPHAHGSVVHTHAPADEGESLRLDSLSKFYLATDAIQLSHEQPFLIPSSSDAVLPISPTIYIVTPPPEPLLLRS